MLGTQMKLNLHNARGFNKYRAEHRLLGVKAERHIYIIESVKKAVVWQSSAPHRKHLFL
jgi:hypothetical protein